MSELIECNVCDGNGSVLIESGINSKYVYCSKCLGMGRVSWIENIFGKQYPLSNDEYWDRMRVEDKFYRKRRSKK
jgi:late competence protein required for DNA uptake (superfamily II DNA/RNA helicase)